MDESKSVPKKWLAQHKNELRGTSDEAVRQLYNGYCIVNCTNNTKKIINNNFNPLWNLSSIPSGFCTKHLVNAIR
jgi:hypothetical protein